MDEVRIYTLGRFSVEIGERSLSESDGSVRASAVRLLKLLVTRPRRRVLRDQALDQLWTDEDVGSGALRGALHSLRKALVDIGGADARSLILRDREYTIGLNPDLPIWVDADAFDDLMRRSRRESDPLALLRAADELYAGEYLPADIYDDWTVARREELKQARLEMLYLLAQHAEQRHEFDEAAAALRRILADDPCDERAAQQLIGLLLRRGRTADARRVYERLLLALRDELGFEPSPGVIKLERELNAAPPEPLPTGTVTFLLTDIESSLRHWEDEPEAMRAALALHDELLTASIHQAGGSVMKMRGEGDSFFAVFSRGSDAVSAACTIQRALSGTTWPNRTPIRVRMALNTGEVEVRDGDYFGTAIGRCARLRAVAHGGQILVTQATRDLVQDWLPAGVQLLDLGEHHLRDFERRERIFQVAGPVDGRPLPDGFPPLRSIGGLSADRLGWAALPLEPSHLVGRELELESAQRLLLHPDTHLLTLTGPLGTGKTRLSLQLARDVQDRFPDGVCFVSLAPVSSPELVGPAIGHVLGLLEGASRPLVEILKDYLHRRQMLLVLDNFEHVMPAALLVAELLQAGPGLTVLVTSRSPLHLRFEREFPVPPLALPDPRAALSLEALAAVPAIRLFVERSRAVRADIVLDEENAPAVAEICARLDGLPLAIELAAARSKLLSPQALLARLGRRLPLLVGGARDLPVHQQTLRGAIAWSYDLLEPAERRLLGRLSTFVGGCTLMTAEIVCDGRADLGIDMLDGIASLIDKSLVRVDATRGPEPRVRMLETIREYGLDQLEAAGEGPELRDRHLDYYLGLVEEAARGLLGPEQVAWCNRLSAEHADIRAALEWVLLAQEAQAALTDSLTRAGTRLEAGIRVVVALELFWMLRGQVRENWPILTALLAYEAGPTPSRAELLVVASSAAHCLLDLATAVALADEGIELWQELGEARGLARALTRRGVYALTQADGTRAESWLTEARAHFREGGGERNSGIEHPIAAFLAQSAQFRGDQERAHRLYVEALAEAQARGDRHAAAYALRHLGRLHLARSETEQAIRSLRAGLPVLVELQDRRCTPPTLEALAYGLGRRKQHADASRLFAAAEAIRETTGMPLSTSDRAHQESERALLSLQLGEDAFGTMWAEGRALSLDEAVHYALRVSADRPSTLSMAHESIVDHTEINRPR